MGPTVCVVSVGTTSKKIAEAMTELDLPATFVFKEVLLNDASEIDGELEPYDVVFSSGNNARILRRYLKKPVISIEPSMYDILLACSKARKYTAKPVLLTHHEAFLTNELADIASMLAVEIVHEKYDRTDNDNIERIIRKYSAMGQECIIGSGLVCEFAEKHSMRSVYLFPEETIRGSLMTAAEMAASIFQKTAQNLSLSTVVNSSKTGIVMADSEGKIVLVNPTALRCVDADGKDPAGQHISCFLDSEAVAAVMSAAARTQFFKEFGGSSCSVEVNPIVTRGEVTDRLLFIEDLSVIRNTEHEFRREVWAQKGFIAKYTFNEYRSKNREFRNFLSVAKSFAKTEEPVVILGETGVGKEVLAQSIHNHSNRAGKAFVAVNCAAIPDNLLESELFGYSEGAFTGAKKGGKEGYFEMAHMGTIFLDEIGEMNLMLQSKLLRVLQERQVLRVGATKLIPFDARIIVATNKNLWQLVEAGTFRCDLYYRLNVLELEVPPLRERSDDTLILFEDFARRLSPPMWALVQHSTAELAVLLSSYSWPGNVRELENFVRMLVAYWYSEMRPEDLFSLIDSMLGKKRLRSENAGLPPQTTQAVASSSGRFGLLKTSEERQIRDALASCGGNVLKTAELLGIHRTTLWRKLKRYGIQEGRDGAPPTS